MLSHEDFFEARNTANESLRQSQDLEERVKQRLGHLPGTEKAHQVVSSAREVSDMLNKLFPEPRDVLDQQQMAQMRKLGEKQQQLMQEAEQLQQQMEQISSELPLFGGEPKQQLLQSRNEMSQGKRAVDENNLPGAARHKRMAADQLAKLRASLEKSGQKNGGNMPLPLGENVAQGEGAGGEMSHEKVEIPRADQNRAAPRFRQELLDAAKQRAPERFEDSVRRYYEELIR